MPFYPDLSPCPYFGKAEADQLVAIGWLDSEHPFTQGKVKDDFADKLVDLLVSPWAPMSILGLADCPFCTESDSVTYKGKTVQTGNLNLFVPGDSILYVTPSLVAHYVLSHSYLPPTQFIEFVLRCPPMRSKEYFEAIVANGPPRYASIVRKKYLTDV
jgi:hypothetical protein